MEISDQKARELSQIPPPESLERIVRFLDEVTRPAAQISLNGVGKGALEFSERQVATMAPLSLKLSAEREQLTMIDLQSFVVWLFTWERTRSSMEVLKRPTADGTITLADQALVGREIVRPGQQPEYIRRDQAIKQEGQGRPEPARRDFAETSGSSPSEARQGWDNAQAREYRVGQPSSMAQSELPAAEMRPPLATRVLGQIAEKSWAVNERLAFAYGGMLLNQPGGVGMATGVPALEASASPMSLFRPVVSPVPTPQYPVPDVVLSDPKPLPPDVLVQSVSAPQVSAAAPPKASTPPPDVAQQMESESVSSDVPQRPPSRPGRKIHVYSDQETIIEGEPSEQSAMQTRSLVAGTPGWLPLVSKALSQPGVLASLLGFGQPFVGSGMSSPVAASYLATAGESSALGGLSNGLTGAPDVGVALAQLLAARPSLSEQLIATQAAAATQMGAAAASPTAFDPLHSQITLVAPPLQVADRQAQEGGAAVQMDWRALASGMGQLQLGDISALASTLPAGVQAIYPALPAGAAGPNAVNMQLAPSALQQLVSSGYGPMAASAISQIPIGSASKSTSNLEAQIVPGRAPTSGKGSVFGGSSEVAGKALTQAGGGQATRSGVLDFMGLPVRMAPRLGGKTELADQIAVRSGAATSSSGAPISPEVFKPFLNKVAPSLQSVNAEPDLKSWQKAAPQFGMKPESAVDILTPDARQKPRSATESLPQSQAPSRSTGPSVTSTGPLGTGSLLNAAPLLERLGRHTGQSESHPLHSARHGRFARQAAPGSLSDGWSESQAQTGGLSSPDRSTMIPHRGRSHGTAGGLSGLSEEVGTESLPLGSSLGRVMDPAHLVHRMSPRFAAPSIMSGAFGQSPRLGGALATGFHEETEDVRSSFDVEGGAEMITRSTPHARPATQPTQSLSKSVTPSTPSSISSSLQSALATRAEAMAPPTMLYKAAPAPTTTRIQTSKVGHSGGQVSASEHAAQGHGHHQGQKGKQKDHGSEVRLMAQEVWSLLRGRIKAERNRMGL